MATYSPASTDVDAIIAEVIGEFYPDLVEAGAKISAVFAYPTLDKDGEPTGPAMVKDDRQILARVKKNSEEDRCAGKADATITIDHEEWDKLSDDETDGAGRKRALIDHELHHLIVRRDKMTGLVATDDRGRPLFKMKPHDWEITGFKAVVERHGRHSYEKRQARQFHDTYGNLLFDFAAEQARLPGVSAEKPKRPRGAAIVAAANR
jgi:hypothetical protein